MNWNAVPFEPQTQAIFFQEYQNTGDGILFVKAKYNYLYILFNVVCKHTP